MTEVSDYMQKKVRHFLQLFLEIRHHVLECHMRQQQDNKPRGTENSRFLKEYCVGKPSDFVWLVT